MLLKSYTKLFECFDLACGLKRAMVIGEQYDGWFYEVEGNFFAIYQQANTVFFQENELKIELTPRHRSRVMTVDGLGTKEFQLFLGDALVHRFKYHCDETLQGIPPFEYLDMDDFDWGRFLLGIVNEAFLTDGMKNFPSKIRGRSAV